MSPGSFKDDYDTAVAQAKALQAKINVETARQQAEDEAALEARRAADAKAVAGARSQYSTAAAQNAAEECLRVPPPRPPPGPPPPLPDPNNPLSYTQRHSFVEHRASFSDPLADSLVERGLSASGHGLSASGHGLSASGHGGPRPPPGPPPPLRDDGLDGSNHSLRRSSSLTPRSAEEVMAAAAARSGSLQRTNSTTRRPPPGPPPPISQYDPYRGRGASYAGQRPSFNGEGQLDRVSLSDPTSASPFGPPRHPPQKESRFACFSFFGNTCK